jgi:hypothetical protein
MSKGHSIDIFDSVVSEKIMEISSEILEAGIDQLIENDFLKDIPILGSGFKAYGLARKITEHFFAKKVLRFLFHLKDIPKDEREKFVKELGSSTQSKKVSEKILVTLNRLDEVSKASIVGKLFKAYIKKNINQVDFFRLSSIVDKIYIDDLIALKSKEHPEWVEIDIKENLAQAGLYTREIKDNRDQEEYLREQLGSPRHKVPPTFEYEPNRLCRLLIKFGL